MTVANLLTENVTLATELPNESEGTFATNPELQKPRETPAITQADIVLRMLSESDANVSALVPVLKTAAKRSNSEYRDYIHAGTKLRKLSSGANKLLGHHESIRKQLFGFKVQASKLRELHAGLVKGTTTLESWNEANIPERDRGIKFTVFQDGIQDSDELMNGDYTHIRKYCGSASADTPRVVDNTQDAFVALENQMQSILGITPAHGMQLRIERDERPVGTDPKTGEEKMRSHESFIFTFFQAPTGGMYAMVKSETATAKDGKDKANTTPNY